MLLHLTELCVVIALLLLEPGDVSGCPCQAFGDKLQAIPCFWAMVYSRLCLDFVCAGHLVGTVDLNHRRSCVLIPVKCEILACRMKKCIEN